MGLLLIVAIILFICFFKSAPFSWCIRVLNTCFLSLFKPKLHKLTDADEITFRVWFSDVDWFMHMNNSMYQYYCDFGRYSWGIRLIGYKNTLNCKLLVGGSFCQYIRSLQLFQKFTLRTQVVGTDGDWLWIQQTFISNGKVYAVSMMKMIYKDEHYNTKTPLEMFKQYKDCTIEYPTMNNGEKDFYQEGYAEMGQHYLSTGTIILNGIEKQAEINEEKLVVRSSRKNKKV
ncbi:hypothetical protein WA158_008414 [Blastocystis sp. Blastoise]